MIAMIAMIAKWSQWSQGDCKVIAEWQQSCHCEERYGANVSNKSGYKRAPLQHPWSHNTRRIISHPWPQAKNPIKELRLVINSFLTLESTLLCIIFFTNWGDYADTDIWLSLQRRTDFVHVYQHQLRGLTTLVRECHLSYLAQSRTAIYPFHWNNGGTSEIKPVHIEGWITIAICIIAYSY